ncbi:hypothetical protein METP3_02116 [Methanosarcinales archaeon]|nr:hypothetical protein METP3_02116 [Methanosarcinales archaeon]
MPENNKTEDFLQKLAPCIERGDLDACVGEAVRLAGEMGGRAELLVFDLPPILDETVLFIGEKQ